MKYHAALVLLLSLAASAYAAPEADKHSPSKPTPKPTSKGGGKGDPILTDFSGRHFEFFGKVGNTYSLLSEKTHQLSMRLKEGVMWDHVGTYMSTLAFQYQDHTVVVDNEGNGLRVSLDGQALHMKEGQSEMEQILGMATGELQLLWQLHRSDLGNAVELTTELLNVVVWVTPAGTRDEGGKVQPAYLNFDVTLLGSPAHNSMEGIIGESYGKVLAGRKDADDFAYHGEEAAHEMVSLFDAAHPKCVFGKAGSSGAGIVRARKLIETHSSITFPLTASFA